MEFLSVATEQGVTERRFDLEVGDAIVPGILWTPQAAQGPRPLVLFGHGGTQHKRVDNILAMARGLVRRRGYAAVAIDAPNHGDRMTAEDAARQRELLREFRDRLPALSDEQLRRSRAGVPRAVLEWKATVDAIQRLDEVGTGPLGYWGLSMGCGIGIPFIAAEPRVTAAVLGLAALRPSDTAFEQSARAVKVPVLFLFQFNDELMTPETGLALFRALGSEIKTMHINPGRHIEIPGFEREHFEAFFARHLERAPTL